MDSGLLVAATTVTPRSSWTPSISFNRLVSTPSWEFPVSPSEVRDVARASISSLNHPVNKRIHSNSVFLTKNIIDGEAARAFRKISLTARSDSPTNLFSSCENYR